MKFSAISPLLAILAAGNLVQANPLSFLRSLPNRDLKDSSLADNVYPHDTHVYEIRAKNDPEPLKYGKVQQKGIELARALNDPNCGAARKDVDYAQLEEENWELDDRKISMPFNLRAVTVDLGLQDGKVYTEVTAEKMGTNKKGEKEPNNYMNAAGDGAIFAMSNSRVDSHSWSDIAYAVWKKFDQGGELNYVFRVDVVNDEAKPLITEEIYPKNDLDWPKEEPQEWEPGTDEYYAILGSPNGSGVAYLLLNHRKEFGQKTVTKITTWAGGFEEHLEIMLEIGDAE